MSMIDRHVSRPNQLCTGLPMLENALLWAMRAWVIGHSRRIDVASRIERLFESLGAPEAAPHLDAFMRVLSRTASRVLEVHCVCHTEVSDDEAALLSLFALQQDESYDEAYALLAELTIESGIVTGCDSACRLVLALRDAGQTLRTMPGDARWSMVSGDSGLPTLH